MIYTHYVDSRGVVGEDNHPVNIPDSNIRLSALNEIRKKINALHGELNDENTLLDVQSFCTDRLSIFFKTPLEASDPKIREMNTTEYKSRTSEMKSIMSSQENGRTQWWYLQVLSCSFERNLNDAEYIKSECETVNIVDYVKDRPDTDVSQILSDAVTDEGFLVSVAEKVSRETIPAGVYPQSNTAMRVLNEILNCRYFNKEEGFYEIYNQFKRFIRSFEYGWRVFYWANAIGFVFNGNDYVVYITKKDKDVKYHLNGNIYNSLEELKEAIKDNSAFEEKEWFDRIRPFLPQRPIKERQSKKPDIIL